MRRKLGSLGSRAGICCALRRRALASSLYPLLFFLRASFSSHIRSIRFSLVSFVVFWKKYCRDKLIQPIKIDITEDGTDHTTLRDTAYGGVEFPIFHISGL